MSPVPLSVPAVPSGMLPIERLSVAEQVARHLLELIRTGSVQPGQQLPTERELAATLQVSRPSIREALRGLQILGVVKMRQGGGIYVSSLDAIDMLQPLQVFLSLSPENFEALHEARLVIEASIGRLACQRMTKPVLDQLNDLVEHQVKLTADPVAFRAADIEVPRVLRQAAGNPVLDRVSTFFFVLGTEYRRVHWETPGMLKRSLDDHRQILAAIAERNPGATSAAMERHMGSVGDTTREAMAEQQETDSTS